MFAEEGRTRAKAYKTKPGSVDAIRERVKQVDVCGESEWRQCLLSIIVSQSFILTMSA